MGYYPKNLHAVPQYVAGLTFYPMGVFFGYYLNLFYLNQATQKLLAEVAVWPICAGVIAAGITAFIQVTIKITYKKYIFEHFYLLMIGLFSMFVGGIIISNNESDVSVSLFVCFIGHGICYVTTLSYINIRIAKSKIRFLKISISGFSYLIGIAVGAHYTIVKVKLEIDRQNEYEEVNNTIGSIITMTSSLILVCYFVNEVLYWINSYDYKSSLDADINRENVSQTLFLDKYFNVSRNDESNSISNCRYEAKLSLNRKTRAFFFIYSNIIPIMYFYFPFIYFNKYIFDWDASSEYYLIFWFGVLGCGISLVVQYFFANRVVYFITMTIKLTGLCLFLVLLDILEWELHSIILFILFFTLGFHYQANDVNILSYGSLKYIEIEIFISYMFQYLAIGIIQYLTIMDPGAFLNFDRDIVLSNHHSLIFIVLLCVGVFLGARVLPKGKQISLLEIRNIINQEQTPVLITHVLSIPRSRAAHISRAYPQSNLQCYQTTLDHYPRIGCHQRNSEPCTHHTNPIVLNPGIFVGRKC